MPARPPHSRLAVVAVSALTATLALAGCQQDEPASSSGTNREAPAANAGANLNKQDPPEAAAAPAEVSLNVKAAAQDVAVDTPVTLNVSDGTFEKVRVKVSDSGRVLAGSLNDEKTEWTARNLLEPGTTYLVDARALNVDGEATRTKTRFQTDDLTLDEQTYASLQPLKDEVVGIGMPVIVQFDIPVKKKAAFERRMEVTASPETVGSWHWISDQEVHWRPKSYWKPGTDVHVDVNVNGVHAGNGIYGQMNRSTDFTIGRSVVMKTDIAKHQMKVFVGGELVRTIPVTAGKPGFETRSGIKLIVEKFRVKVMDASTIGIEPGDSEYYNIPDVEYAQRVTYTGEFIHAAPWSVGSQGYSNVSHGCVGMSTEDAAWLYGITHRGDPVVTKGTDRGLEDNNGWTDWEQSFAEYKQASALD